MKLVCFSLFSQLRSISSCYKFKGRIDSESEGPFDIKCFEFCQLTHISLASLLWDIGKQHSPICDTAERSVPSEAILFAKRTFIKQVNKKLKSLLMPLKMKVDSPKR